MKINKNDLKWFWYEDSNGNVFVPKENNLDVPEGFIYQHSRFPCELHHTCLEIIQQDKVDSCKHLKFQQEISGRQCHDCGGRQYMNHGGTWGEWGSYGSRKIFRGTSTYPKDLVLAMVNPRLKEWIKAFFRNKLKTPKKYELNEAIIIASSNCERCMNALFYIYGLEGGYPEKSDEWYNSGTICDYCEHMPKRKPTIETKLEDLLS